MLPSYQCVMSSAHLGGLTHFVAEALQMIFQQLLEKARKLLDRYIHWIVILVMSLGVFLFIAVMNPQTLVWVGLVQLDCELPEHSKCLAQNPVKNLFGSE